MSRVETLISFFGERRPGTPAPVVPDPPVLTDEQRAVIAEACSKSGVAWIRTGDDGTRRLAWQVWHDGAVHVVYGVGEQMLPMLTGHVEVSVPSKENHATLVVFLARAQILAAHSARWQEAAEALRAKRLNTVDVDAQLERWAQGCLISRLEPVHLLALGPGGADAPSGAQRPRPTANTTTHRRPWHLGGRRGRGRSRARSGPPP